MGSPDGPGPRQDVFDLLPVLDGNLIESGRGTAKAGGRGRPGGGGRCSVRVNRDLRSLGAVRLEVIEGSSNSQGKGEDLNLG